MNIKYTDEQKAQMIVANEEYVNNLRIAIKEGKVGEYFDSFGFKPRLLEIVELLSLWPDGEQVIYALYDYLMLNVKDIHIPSMTSKLVKYSSIVPFLVRDSDNLIARVTETKSCTDSLYIFTGAILKLPGGDKIILNQIDKILEASHPALIFSTVKLLDGNLYFDDFFKNNFDKFVKISRGRSVIELVEHMMRKDERLIKEYLQKNLDATLSNVGGGLVYYFISSVLKGDWYIKFIKNNIDIVIDNCSAVDINSILDGLDTKYNLGLEKNHDVLLMLKEKMSADKKNHLAIGAIVKSRKNEYLKEVIAKLMEENHDFIQSIGDSSWSNIVFKIGDKVLKLGWVRNNPNCPDHTRIVKPLYFETVYDKRGNPVLYIEIQDYLTQQGISEADIQSFYDDIEKDDLIYIDPRGKNPTNFGFMTNDHAEHKKLLLLDRDCVWSKHDKNINYMNRY